MGTNKVEFGLEEVHVGTYTEAADGTVTLGEGSPVKGAVSLGLDPTESDVSFYADNVQYFKSTTAEGFTGTLTMALFPDAFKTAFLDYATLADGGIAELKGTEKSPVYISFQGLGDAEKRRHILYNVSLGNIKREYKSIGEGKEVETEEISITVVGDNTTKICKVSYGESATGYTTLFSAPPVPVAPAGL